MRLGGYVAAFFVISSFGSVFGKASLDPRWLYKDIVDTDRVYYSLAVYDTCRTRDINKIMETDTGDKYDSIYINFDYKFSADSFYYIDPYSIPPYDNKPDTLIRDYRPGFAGFKIDWDGGVNGFPVAKYKYLVFAHKGPLPNHKVTIRFGYNTTCGSPTGWNTIGSVTASSAWKVDSILLPDSMRNLSDSAKNKRNYYEMQVLINNADPSDTNKSSARGVFKIDNIALVDTGGNASVLEDYQNDDVTPTRLQEKSEESKSGCGCGSGAGLALIPPLWFKARAFWSRKKRDGRA
jgi:hypothetical protein